MPLIELAHADGAPLRRDYSAVVGIPVHNEENYIARCLSALDRQQGEDGDYATFLLLNNCTDGTLDVVRSCAATLQHDIYLVNIQIPRHIAHAGTARKMAMDNACRLTRTGGIVLTTDADAIVAEDWLLATRRHIAAGADAVIGFVRHNPMEMAEWSAMLKQRTELEYVYEDLLAELNGLLDPLPHDPCPRHMVVLGASLASTREAYMKCGGIPPIRCGEDRGFAAALERIDAKVRYPRDVVAFTSARLNGHADGGMAATLMAREMAPELPCDELLESVAMACKRATWRRELRQIWPSRLPEEWTEKLGIPQARLEAIWSAPAFGQAWQCIEAGSPELKRRPMSLAELQRELLQLQSLVGQLRPDRVSDLSDTAQSRLAKRQAATPERHSSPALSTGSTKDSGRNASSDVLRIAEPNAKVAGISPPDTLPR